MKIFKSMTLAWWQFGLLKISMICLGVILGVYFQAFFLKWIVIVTILFVVFALYIAQLWFRKDTSDISKVQ